MARSAFAHAAAIRARVCSAPAVPLAVPAPVLAAPQPAQPVRAPAAKHAPTVTTITAAAVAQMACSALLPAASMPSFHVTYFFNAYRYHNLAMSRDDVACTTSRWLMYRFVARSRP